MNDRTKPKENKPLLTREPLPHINDRERKQAPQAPKKRKRPQPTKPPLTFEPSTRPIASGRQDSLASVCPGPSASGSSFDESPLVSFPDHEIHDQVYDGYDAQKRLRFSEQWSSDTSNLATPSIDPCDSGSVPSELYDSPVSHTSSSSPAPSDQSPCVPEFAAHVVDYPLQPQDSLLMYQYGNHGYIQQSTVQQEYYGYSMDPRRAGQGPPVQYVDTTYGRGGPYSPTHPDNHGYPSLPHKY